MSDPWPPEDDTTRALRDALRATADATTPQDRLDQLRRSAAADGRRDDDDRQRGERPGGQGRRRGWLPVAAAVVLVVGIGVPVGIRLAGGGASATSGAAQDHAESTVQPSLPSPSGAGSGRPAAEAAFVTADASVACLVGEDVAICTLRVAPSFDAGIACPPDARLSVQASPGTPSEPSCVSGADPAELATMGSRTGWHTVAMPTVLIPELEAQAAVLPDDLPLTVGTVTCRTTGSQVTCTAAGMGFTLSATRFARI